MFLNSGFFISFMMHRLDSIPGNKDITVFGLNVNMGLLKSFPSVFREQSELRTTDTDTVQFIHIFKIPVDSYFGCFLFF